MYLTATLLMLQIITMTAWSETNIRKTEEGRRLLDNLSARGGAFLHWRANADHKNELRLLGRLSGWATAFSIVFFMIGPNAAKPMISVYFMVFLVMWVSILAGRNLMRQTSKMLEMATLAFCAPYIMLIADWAHAPMLGLAESYLTSTPLISNMGLSGIKLAFVLSLMAASMVIFMHALGMLFSSLIPASIFCLMFITSKASRKLLGWEISRARNYLAIYVCAVGPTLLALHATKMI